MVSLRLRTVGAPVRRARAQYERLPRRLPRRLVRRGARVSAQADGPARGGREEAAAVSKATSRRFESQRRPRFEESTVRARARHAAIRLVVEDVDLAIPRIERAVIGAATSRLEKETISTSKRGGRRQQRSAL